jgi:Fe-S cluster assembly ATP-binding protein
MLQLLNVELELNGRKILHNVNLSIREAEIHSILGVNGTGKSTLAAAIMGLSGYESITGKVLFRGENITSLPVFERARRGITLAWQEPARFEGLTIAEYLEIGKRASGNEFLSAKECLAKVGLEPTRYLARAVDATLSGGERRRVELASVLVMKPKLVILDEPDSGIDALSIDNIVNVIRTLAKAGTAVLLITHHEEVAAIADRSSSLCAGTVLKTADPQTIARFFRNHCLECAHPNEPAAEEPYA